MNIAYEPSELENIADYFPEKRVPGYKERLADLRNAEVAEKLIKVLQSATRDTEARLFDLLMKIEWLDRHFEYGGKAIADLGPKHGMAFDYALAMFFRKNFEYTPAYFRFSYFKVIRSYSDDIFPEFNSRDPLEPFTFPYKHMNFESLLFVWRMEGRMALLAMGEKHAMNYSAFRDYVIKAQTKFFHDTGRRHKMYWNMNDASAPYLGEILTLEEEIKRKRI